MRNTCSWLCATTTLTGAAFGAAALLPCAFTNAGGGTPLAFEVVQLPALDLTPGPGLPFAPRPSPWAPPTTQLLQGEVIVRNAAQMQDVWQRLFDVPYDAAQFDFSSSFVVLMGGGLLPPGAGFGIDCVESVTGNYDDVGALQAGTEPFLSICATVFYPGVPQPDPPPAAYQVSAVKIDKALFDDIVFHRRSVMGV